MFFRKGMPKGIILLVKVEMLRMRMLLVWMSKVMWMIVVLKNWMKVKKLCYFGSFLILSGIGTLFWEDVLFWLYQTLNQALYSTLGDHLLSLSPLVMILNHCNVYGPFDMLMEQLLYLYPLGNIICFVLNIYMILNQLIHVCVHITTHVMDHLIMDEFMPKF